ncbi:MAG: transcription termination factor NusA [Oscillospiraceae bacterium]|jgi:N utilization substance protein A|nr:transcription termination factor NusA [Oscillospiraceae bacterium]
MNTEFFEALALLEKEKGIPMEYLTEKIKNAISIAVKRDAEGTEESIVDIDPETGRFYVAFRKRVVDVVEDPANEIMLEQARKIDSKATIDSIVEIPMETKQFGRIAAQAAKHVIRQGIREGERDQLLHEYQSRQQDIVSATVLRVDERKGNVTIEMGKSEAILPKSEQLPGETFREGERIRVYVVDVMAGEKGPRLMISRTHPGLVKRLFEMQVPEIYDGTVEIKSIAREAGSRTKIAVWSKDENVDAQGACIGPKGARVGDIVDELGGEKIDVVKYSEDPSEFIAEALSPAQVLGVEIESEESRSCKVTVPDQQLSLAIGNKGQNARLAARLTGWKIDIRPESGFFGEEG